MLFEPDIASVFPWFGFWTSVYPQGENWNVTVAELITEAGTNRPAA